MQTNNIEIKLIRNYINFHKKEVSRDAIKNYVTEVQKAIKLKQLTQSSEYFKEIESIRKRMEQTLNKIKSKRLIIEIGKEDLNNYLKIITSKPKTVQGVEEKPIAGSPKVESNAIPEVMSIGELAKMPYKILPFTGMWKEIFGDPTKPFRMLIHGDSHRGKTTLLLKLVTYLATNFGKVMYVSSEEYPAPTLIKKVRELISPFPKGLDFSGSLNAFKISDYDFVVIDSVNHMKLTMEAFKKLKRDYPLVCFILIFQETQEGRIRGGKDWEHEMDIAADLYDYGKIKVFKNRCSGVYSNYNFLEESPVTVDPDLKKAKIHLNGLKLKGWE